MTREELIVLAVKAGLNEHLWLSPKIDGFEEEVGALEKFAEHVARLATDSQKPLIIYMMVEAMTREREICAQLAENEPRRLDANAPDPQTRIAAAIRERNQR